MHGRDDNDKPARRQFRPRNKKSNAGWYAGIDTMKPEDVIYAASRAIQSEKQFLLQFHVVDILIKSIESYPECATKLITYMITHQAVFDKLIENFKEFNKLSLTLAGQPQADNALIQFLFSHPDEFERLVKDVNQVETLQKHYCQYSSFFSGKEPRLITRELKLNIISIHRAVWTLWINNEQKDSIKLPNDIILKIACYAATDSSLLSIETTKKYADDKLTELKEKKKAAVEIAKAKARRRFS